VPTLPGNARSRRRKPGGGEPQAAGEAKNTTTLDDRLKALAQEKNDARAKLDEAMRSEKAGAAIREEKFRKLLEVAKDEPIEKPIRDIDLD